MIAKTLGRVLIAATACFALNSMADTLPQAKINEMMSLKMMDTNKDGMVSKAEFLEMAGKVYDMKAKEMGAQGGKVNAAQLKEMGYAIFSSFQQ